MPAVASAAPVARPTPTPKKVWPAAFETRDETKPYETTGVVYFDKPFQPMPMKQTAAIKPAPVVVAAAVKPAPVRRRCRPFVPPSRPPAICAGASRLCAAPTP